MKLTALVERVDHVCCRYRLTAFRPALAAAGHTLDLLELPKALLARLRLYRSMKDSDAVILQRTLLSRFELEFLRRSAKRLLFDFDDAIWLRDSYAAKPTSHKRQRRFARTLRMADAAIAGNDFLADAAKKYCRDVRTIPTCVKIDPLAPNPTGSSTVRLVWVGSASTLNSLERIRPILQTLGQRFPNVTLKLICDRFANYSPLKVQNIPWHADTEAADIADAEIGIATMPDDDWSRGKCGLKVLQYMAAGLPVIANAVGVHTQMIQHGDNGYLANTADEWINTVTQLQNPELRKRYGDAGREKVQQHYSVAVGARGWLDTLGPLELRVAC